MSNFILAAASYEKQKYYLEPMFQKLPEGIQEEIRIICVTTAQKLTCTFLMGFRENGEIYFETVKREDDFDFDEIGAELEVKEIFRTQKQLLASLSAWFTIYFTDEGEKLKDQLLE
ncbi:hypothetical protein CLNEO_25570 [Anaerotignum neopropionicum]|uniref:Uncharacterized protein n=1 Tax=Anaerotignum neopropionicum TaxID=36847 RepID=A0A136WBZ2_9FIRM|nr:DUF6145 family protein [Anaerotignum neopropionicum]KXL52041.1 hypothetical protein CLNEO_25570 [Anaerotignum neopropionicum]